MDDRKYRVLAEYCEGKLAQHGDSFLGVGWTRAFDAEMFNKVMLEAIRPEDRPASVLDLGCGLSHLYQHLRDNGVTDVTYTGLDLSPRYVAESRRKFPDNEYLCMDVLEDDTALGVYDYVFINGIFTIKITLSQDEMVRFFRQMVKVAFRHCRKGLVFNTMSKQVQWERDDLFHLSLDELASFLCAEVSRHFVVRHDYGLYQQFVYVYRDRCALNAQETDRRSPFAERST